MEYSNVRKEDEALVGKAAEGSRTFERYAKRYEFAEYFKNLTGKFGAMLNPGSASLYVGVTRAAVYKRMKTGKLTAFGFLTDPNTFKTLGGMVKIKTDTYRTEYFVPEFELRQWRNQLIEKHEANFGPRAIGVKDIIEMEKAEDAVLNAQKKKGGKK